MIIVDIEVPSMERKYQFNVEEQVPVETLIAELAEVIAQKEQCALQGNVAELCLCSEESRRILSYRESAMPTGFCWCNRLFVSKK